MYRLAAAIVLALLVVPTFADTGPFSPVPKDHWAYSAVDQLQKDGIVVGYPSGVLKESKEMSRYEFAVAAARVAYLLWPDVLQNGTIAGQKDKQGPMPDLKPTSDDFKIMQKLTDEFRDEMAGLGVDVDKLKRKLSEAIAREQPVQKEIIRGRLVAEPSPFSDVPKGHWAYDAVNQLKKDGILVGYPDGAFNGKMEFSRYEFAVAIARMIPMIHKAATGLSDTRQQVDDLNRRISALERGEVAPPLATKEDLKPLATKPDLNRLNKLVDEFKDELTALDYDVDQVKRDVATVDDRLAVGVKEVTR